MAGGAGLRAAQRLASLLRRGEVDSVAAGRRALRADGYSPPSYATVRRHPELFPRDEETGRYSVSPIDYGERVMDVVTIERRVERDAVVRSSSDASKVGVWANALRNFLVTGDESALAALSDRDVTIRSGRARLETDPGRLEQLADAGELDDFMRNYHAGRRR